jgi:hypothetical protein
VTDGRRTGEFSIQSENVCFQIVKRITYEEEISEQMEANLAEMEAIQKAVLSLEDRNEQECLRCRYIDVIEDEEGNRKRLTWRYVALRVYRKDDENAIRATTRLHKRALESVKRWVSDQ